ncbi:hypothetical protein Bca101_054949 [Brassica carinata]
MGKPARWLKSVLLTKPYKPSGSKDKEARRVVNGKEVVVVSKIEDEVVSDDEIQLAEVQVQTSPNNFLMTHYPNQIKFSKRLQQQLCRLPLEATWYYLTVATLCSVMGIAKLQALARGKEVRCSDIGVQVHRKCRLKKHPEDSVVDTHTYLGIKKLTTNVFAQKLLASASCFWKPVSQPKKTSVKKIQKKFASNNSQPWTIGKQ